MGSTQNWRARNNKARRYRESYGFFGGVVAGCKGAGCDEAGAVLEAGGLLWGAGVCGTGVGVAGVVAGVFTGAGLET